MREPISAGHPRRKPHLIVTESAVLKAVPEVEPETCFPSSSRRRIPWSDLLGLLVSSLIVVVAFSPVVFGGRTFSTAAKVAGTNGYAPFRLPDYGRDLRVDPWAQSWQAEPWAEVAHRAYADRELPLWNPYQGVGAPLAANMQSAAFDPLLLAVDLHPTPLTWDLSILGAFVLGAAAAYLFGRVLGLQVVPAVVGSAAFSLSGWFFLFSNNAYSRSYVFLPLLFLLVELTLRSRRWWWPVLALGVAIAENIYIGMPEASFFVIGAAAVYAVVRLVQERTTMPIRISIARLGGASVLGVLLAAPLLLLFLEYEPLSYNTHKPELDRGTEADPALGILHWILPFFPGGPETKYPTGYPKNWFGVAIGIVALVALSGRRETKRLHAWLFFVLGALLLAKIYGSGLVNWIGSLPVAKLVIFPVFASPVVSFAFAMLAGIGVQVLWNRDLRLRRFLTLLASALTVLAAIVLTGDHSRVVTSENVLVVWSRRALFAVLVIAAVVLAARVSRRFGASLVAGLIVAELFRLATPVNVYAERADPFLAPGWMPLVRTAQASEPNLRVFGVDGKLYPNTAARSDCRTFAPTTPCTSSGTGATCEPSSSRRSRSISRARVRFRASKTTRCSTRLVCGRSFRSKTSRTCLRSGFSAEIAIRVSTKTPTPIRGPGSCTTSMSSEAKTKRLSFSRRVHVARTTRSSWIHSTRGAKPSSSTGGRSRMSCVHCWAERTNAPGESATARPSSATRETLWLFG